jgi:hypothetical protein
MRELQLDSIGRLCTTNNFFISGSNSLANFLPTKEQMSNIRVHDTSGASLHSIPVSLSSERHGWKGSHMGLSREQPTSRDMSSPHAAVDLSQFRNETIGVGYQARHVIRQPRALDSSINIHDMTQEVGVKNAKLTKRKRDSMDNVKSEKKSSPLYLACPGLRQFRKELAAIESSST